MAAWQSMGTSWQSAPKAVAASASDAAASAPAAGSPVTAYAAPRRADRSIRGIQLMQLALGLAQKLEDSCVTAACVLHLALLLVYWCVLALSLSNQSQIVFFGLKI